jgi:hypothetical protein
MRRTILGVLFSLVLVIPAAAADRRQVSLEDLTLLAESDISDQTILAFLGTRELEFQLDSETIARLRQQGVSEEVIRYLLERTDTRNDRVDRVEYVSADPYPPRYYVPYYGYEVFPYFGAAILWHWTYGFHWVGDHFVGGHHLGVYGGHSASHGARHYGGHSGSHGARHYASAGHLVGEHRSRSHSSSGHAAVSHLGSRGASHAGAGHSSGGHSSSGHGSGRHGSGGHGGGGH